MRFSTHRALHQIVIDFYLSYPIKGYQTKSKNMRVQVTAYFITTPLKELEASGQYWASILKWGVWKPFSSTSCKRSQSLSTFLGEVLNFIEVRGKVISIPFALALNTQSEERKAEVCQNLSSILVSSKGFLFKTRPKLVHSFRGAGEIVHLPRL